MWDSACRWARPRLPLLAGGELSGGDRRRVERHLIGCPACRNRLESLASSLGVLRLMGQETVAPAPSDAPSLWPALARQIREEKHFEPAFGPTYRPALIGLGVAATVAIAAGVATWSMGQTGRRSSMRAVASSAPKPPAPAPVPDLKASESSPTVADATGSKSESEAPSPVPPSPSRKGDNPPPPSNSGRISAAEATR